jgi:hypothetical protein
VCVRACKLSNHAAVATTQTYSYFREEVSGRKQRGKRLHTINIHRVKLLSLLTEASESRQPITTRGSALEIKVRIWRQEHFRHTSYLGLSVCEKIPTFRQLRLSLTARSDYGDHIQIVVTQTVLERQAVSNQ